MRVQWCRQGTYSLTGIQSSLPRFWNTSGAVWWLRCLCGSCAAYVGVREHTYSCRLHACKPIFLATISQDWTPWKTSGNQWRNMVSATISFVVTTVNNNMLWPPHVNLHARGAPFPQHQNTKLDGFYRRPWRSQSWTPNEPTLATTAMGLPGGRKFIVRRVPHIFECLISRPGSDSTVS